MNSQPKADSSLSPPPDSKESRTAKEKTWTLTFSRFPFSNSRNKRKYHGLLIHLVRVCTPSFHKLKLEFQWSGTELKQELRLAEYAVQTKNIKYEINTDASRQSIILLNGTSSNFLKGTSSSALLNGTSSSALLNGTSSSALLKGTSSALLNGDSNLNASDSPAISKTQTAESTAVTETTEQADPVEDNVTSQKPGSVEDNLNENSENNLNQNSESNLSQQTLDSHNNSGTDSVVPNLGTQVPVSISSATPKISVNSDTISVNINTRTSKPQPPPHGDSNGSLSRTGSGLSRSGSSLLKKNQMTPATRERSASLGLQEGIGLQEGVTPYAATFGAGGGALGAGQSGRQSGRLSLGSRASFGSDPKTRANLVSRSDSLNGSNNSLSRSSSGSNSIIRSNSLNGSNNSLSRSNSIGGSNNIQRISSGGISQGGVNQNVSFRL